MFQYKIIKKRVAHPLVLVILVCAFPFYGSAQTFGEFFNQKKTQKRYLLQQIAAFQVYIGYAKKGYDLVGSGLHAIKDLSNGEFSLHHTFISSLSRVSPVIRGNAKLAEIIAYQLEILQSFRKLDTFEVDGLVSAANSAYVSTVRAKVLSDCAGDLQELILVVAPGLVEMDDQQRLLRLDKLYLSMQDKAAFAQGFCTEVSVLAGSRKLEERNMDFLKRAYENLE
jgi:hypothetical protein